MTLLPATTWFRATVVTSTLPWRYEGVVHEYLTEMFAREAASKAAPDDLLFVDDDVYQWRALDELAVATYYTGKLQESADLNHRLLTEGKLPGSERARIEANSALAGNA